MFKKILFQLHWFLGITAGLILSIVGVTGAIQSYEPQILRLLNQESYVVKAEQRDKLTPQQLYQHFTQQQPEIKINSITIAHDPTASSVINIVKEGERKGYNMMVNPYSAEVLPEIKGRGFFAGVQSLHRWLTVGKIGDREVGKQIVGASVLMLIFFVLSGLYFRFPRKHSFRQWFVVKKELKGRNFLWDLHAVVGTWVAIFYLILACTGLTWSYPWWKAGMYKVLGVEQPAPPKPDNKNKKESAPSISQDEISTILNTTWTNVTAQLGREYSTITLNIPKQVNGKIDVSYVDVVPQHERARNTVVFDYANNQITKHEIYESKPLNEKIMSSMLPVHRGSFFGSFYQFFAMLASLAMPLFFITGWLLYIKRREQKIRTEQAMQTVHLPTGDDKDAEWLIVYATQSGTAEQLAWQTANSLQQAGQSIAVRSIQEVQEQELTQHPRLLMIASTFGTGESPDLAVKFVQHTMSKTLDLAHVQYAVLALGSKEYADTFCLFGNQIASWLQACGATPMFETINVDNGNANDIQRWNTALAQVSNLELGEIQLDKPFHTWTLVQRDCLNEGTTGQPAFNIELENADGLTWNAGDIAEIQTGNEDQRIHDFITRMGTNCCGDEFTTTGLSLFDALRYKDLTGEIPSFSNIDQLVDGLANLPCREYSIANIPDESQTTQRLRLVVRQHQDKDGNLGLGSGWLTQHLAVGQTLELHLRSNPSFHLIDDERPIIYIGNGTGVAGLMSLIHARAKRQHHQNWLIFGERQKAVDFFYQTQLNTWQETGVLQRLDTAFSRDQAEKIYVQDILAQSAEDVKVWIEQGAVIYVCGSIDGMASGVDKALTDMLGADGVEQLRQAQRYRRDVY